MTPGLKGFSFMKSGFICCGVLCAALTLKQMTPVLTELASFIVLCIQTCVKPPYLYLLINFIILAVIVSSRFQQAAISNQNGNKVQYSVPPPVAAAFSPEYSVTQEAPIYNHQLAEDRQVMDEAVVIGSPLPLPMQMVVYDERSTGEAWSTEVPTEEKVISFTNQTSIDDEEEKFAVSVRNKRTDGPDISPAKPLNPARNLHRKNSKSMSEVVRAQEQRAAAPKHSNRPTETLESAWRKITEGRQMKKSATWAVQNRPISSDDGQQRKSFKSVFDPRLSASARSNRVNGVDLGRAVSPSQDDLNRRVEAFIRKFNEEMRLQREESMRQYNEMLRRGV